MRGDSKITQASKPKASFAKDAIRELGWWKAHRFLLLRRTCQLGLMALFAMGPWLGLWLFKGNLSASVLLDTIPLADPLVTLQLLSAGHLPEASLLLGAAIIGVFYALMGGRVFCSWVCPVNMVTDLAAYLRRRFALPRTPELPQSLRYFMLAMVLLLPLLTGVIAWEWLNPVPLLYRALLFGAGLGLGLLLAIFLADLLIVERLWCSHLCPSGALFALLGKASPLKMTAVNAKDCNNCMDCFSVCPERKVLKSALKGQSPVITDSDCTLCGRCIDVCAKRVFQYQNRFTFRVNQAPICPDKSNQDKSNQDKINQNSITQKRVKPFQNNHRIANKAENDQ